MLDAEKILKRTSILYGKARGYDSMELRSEQVISLCRAMVEAINKELKKRPIKRKQSCDKCSHYKEINHKPTRIYS